MPPEIDQTPDHVITPGAELRALLTITWPLAVAYLGEVAMLLTDMAVVGRLGNVELAAVGLMEGLVAELIFFAATVISIVGVLAAQAFGAHHRNGVSDAVVQGLWVATLLAVPATVLCWNMAPLLAKTGQAPEVMALAEDYLHAISGFVLPTLWFVTLRNFVSALARPRSVMVITVVAVGLNLALDYVLVFGKLGMPALGVAGAGWATTIVAWAMFAALAWHVWRASGFKPYGIFAQLFRLNLSTCREIVRLGLPVGGIAIIEGGMFIVISILAGVLGTYVLAANQVVIACTSATFVISLAVGEACAIRVAFNLGGGSPHAARQAGYIGLGLGVVAMAIAAVIIISVPRAIVAVFLDLDNPANHEVLALAATMLSIAAAFQVFDGVQVIAARALRGLKDTTVPMWIAAFGYWPFGVAGGYALAFPLGLGGAGLWWGLALGTGISGILLAWRFHARATAEIGKS